MVLSIEERIFLVEHVFRANGEYTESVKQEFLESFPQPKYLIEIWYAL